MAIRCSVRLLTRTAPVVACLLGTWLSVLYRAAETSNRAAERPEARLRRPAGLVLATPATVGSTGVRHDRVEAKHHASVQLDLMLANPLEGGAAAAEETLQCVEYSGPCFFMNHPTGQAPTQPVAAARLEALARLQPAPLPLRPFALHDVRLLPSTRFHTAQQTNLRWLRSLDPDRLLFYFRNLSGLPQPRGVKPHGGWDGAGTGLRGHIVGHYLSAAAMAAAATGDAVLLTNLDTVTRGLEACQNALGDGYLSGFPSSEL